MDAAEALRLWGTTEPAPERRTLACGPLACDWCEGAVQAVRWHGVEVLRGVAYLLRDRDWGTVPARVEDLVLREEPQAFELRHRLVMATPEGTLIAQATLRGTSEGHLSFEVDAVPDAPLTTSRCGFVVLLSAALAGADLAVEHTDGQTTRTAFPREISPSQPVFDIRSLTYDAEPGVRVVCRLEAELPSDPRGRFEMEDQRNWSDASFKTYVGSLLDPWPYLLPTGRVLAQRVSLTLSGVPATSAHPRSRPIGFGLPTTVRMPAIGVGVPPGLARAEASEVKALRALGAAWWIVEAALDDAALVADLKAIAAARIGSDCRVQLDVIVPGATPPEAAASAAAAACASAGLTVEAIRMLPDAYLLSHQPTDTWPDLPPLSAYARAARDRFPGAAVGGGMYTSYTELNRKRPAAAGLDFIGHLTTPLVHAPDDASVMQTLATLPHIAHSVGVLWPGLPYRLGPSTIALRRNPYGSTTAANPARRRLAVAAADPRHGAAFGAAWTVGYAAAVASLGLEVLALHESHGLRGPLAGAAMPIPAWRWLAMLAEAGGAPVVSVLDLPDGVAGVAWESEQGVRGLLANLGVESKRLAFEAAVVLDGGGPAREFSMSAYQVLSFVQET